MALDASRITNDERDELLVALTARRAVLEKRAMRDDEDPVGRDARWRVYVVSSLIHDLHAR